MLSIGRQEPMDDERVWVILGTFDFVVICDSRKVCADRRDFQVLVVKVGDIEGDIFADADMGGLPRMLSMNALNLAQEAL